MKENRIRVAAVLTLASLYTVATKEEQWGEQTRAGSRKSGQVPLISFREEQELWPGLLQWPVPHWYLMGSAQVPFGGNLGESGP